MCLLTHLDITAILAFVHKYYIACSYLLKYSCLHAHIHGLFCQSCPKDALPIYTSRTLHAYPGTTPHIDGTLDPKEWADAFSFSSDGWVPQFSPVTVASDLHMVGFVKKDEQYLYFGFNVSDDIIYGHDNPAWVPEDYPYANELSPRGFPWFGDEMELLLYSQQGVPPAYSNQSGEVGGVRIERHDSGCSFIF